MIALQVPYVLRETWREKNILNELSFTHMQAIFENLKRI